MPWKPAPRWDKYNKRYHVTVRGKRYILGRDYAKALRRLAELLDGQDRTNSIDVMIGEWLKNHSSDWHENLVKKLHLFLTDKKIETVASDLLERYATHLRNAGLKPQTQRHYVNAATSILRLAKRQGRITEVPYKPKLPPIRRRPKDLDEVSLRELLTALQRPGLERASRLIRFILATGCRPGEGRLLRWEEVRLEQRVCLLDRHKNEHHGQNRTIYLSDHAVAILREATIEEDRGGHVFRSSRGQPYTKDGLRSILRRLGATPYQLRHSYAQVALSRVPMEDVARLLGHSGTEMVHAYCRIRDRRALKAVQEVGMGANITP